jgi:hypothetical protein
MWKADGLEEDQQKGRGEKKRILRGEDVWSTIYVKTAR